MVLPCCEIKGLCLLCAPQQGFPREQTLNGWPPIMPVTNQNTTRPVYIPNVLKVSTVKGTSILSESSTGNVKWLLWFECKLSPPQAWGFKHLDPAELFGKLWGLQEVQPWWKVCDGVRLSMALLPVLSLLPVCGWNVTDLLSGCCDFPTMMDSIPLQL